MRLTAAQQLISYLINSTIGQSAVTSKQFETVFRDAPPGEPDSLLHLCIKWLFRNGDFSHFHNEIKRFVAGKPLSEFSDGRLMHCPDLMRLIIENSDNKSRKNKFAIGKDQFSICAGRYVLMTIPFTDMEEAAKIMADYTGILFSFKHYDMEYAFEGNYGLNRNMDLTQEHILLFSKVAPYMFAEKGNPRGKRERNGRLQLRMTRITWHRSGMYYNALMELFKSLRATIVVQGEQPICKKAVTYQQALEHTLANPGVHLQDENASLDVFHFSKRKQRLD